MVSCPHRVQPRVAMKSWHRWSHQAGVSIAVSLIPDPGWARTGKSKADPEAGGSGHWLSSWTWAKALGIRQVLLVAWLGAASRVRWLSCGDGGCRN